MDTFRRRLLFQTASKHAEEYTPCRYIENPQSAYIDTGIVPNKDTKIEIVLESTVYEPWAMLFGARNGSETIGYFISYHAFPGWVMHQFGNGLSATIQTELTGKVTIIQEDGVLNINGKAFDAPTTEYEWNLNLFLFGLNLSGTYEPGNKNLRIYSCKIYQAGRLMRDFVPMTQSESGDSGMYDKVENRFYLSPNSEKFKKGV